jgi:hypothetical protein
MCGRIQHLAGGIEGEIPFGADHPRVQGNSPHPPRRKLHVHVRCQSIHSGLATPPPPQPPIQPKEHSTQRNLEVRLMANDVIAPLRAIESFPN